MFFSPSQLPSNEKHTYNKKIIQNIFLYRPTYPIFFRTVTISFLGPNAGKQLEKYKDWSIIIFQFLLIFRKAAAGELDTAGGLYEIYQQLSEIDVDKEGVGGAKNFFEAKVRYGVM